MTIVTLHRPARRSGSWPLFRLAVLLVLAGVAWLGWQAANVLPADFHVLVNGEDLGQRWFGAAGSQGGGAMGVAVLALVLVAAALTLFVLPLALVGVLLGVGGLLLAVVGLPLLAVVAVLALLLWPVWLLFWLLSLIF